tara:strand:+ start:905 stop:1246 length:342 start_codon:yes stop_codon:yes gene_type:complete
MSLITRGMGSRSTLITSGFGPELATAEQEHHNPKKTGRRSPAHKIDPIDIYTVSARLLSVNRKNMNLIISGKERSFIDRRDKFSVNVKGKITITKTSPTRNIFINVLNVFKKK